MIVRQQHLAKEKELTRLRDQLSQERRDLPWVKVDKPYIYHHLDVLPKGRDEAGLSYPQEWVKHHDQY